MMFSVIPWIFIVAIFQVEAVDYDYDGSGSNLCIKKPCLNGGTCVEGTDCFCTSGWEGPDCSLYIGDQMRRTTGQGRVYAYIPKNVTFQEAMERCTVEYGRILFNATTAHLAIRGASFRRYVGSQEFWAIPGTYPDIMPHLIGNDCPTSNMTGNTGERLCTSKLPTICVTNAQGYCYPEITKKYCGNKTQDVCEMDYTEDGAKMPCRCRKGLEYDLSSDKCIDINECPNRGYGLCSPNKATTCKNIYATYRCECPDDAEQGDGYETCGYVLTMEQKHIDLTQITTVSRLDDSPTTIFLSTLKTTTITRTSTTAAPIISEERAKAEIKDKLEHIFIVSTKSIKKLSVKTLNMSAIQNASAVYDIYVSDDKLTPSSMIEFYNEASRQNKLYWMKGSYPVIAPLYCTPSQLRLGDESFNFSRSNPGEAAGSKQKCPDGRIKAFANCVIKKNLDGSSTAYYDYKSVKTVPCEATVDDIEKASTVNSPEEVETVMADLDSMTTDFKNVDETNLKQATDAMKNVANYVWSEKVDISMDAMTSMVSVANNINKGQKYSKNKNGSAQLTAEQKKDVVMSLERCSTHVPIEPSKSVTIESEAMTLQMTNSVKNSSETGVLPEVSFGRSSSTRDPCHLYKKPSYTEAMINEDILATARNMKLTITGNVQALPVSFINFKDAEFFPPDKEGRVLEEVLSVRIADLNLTNLQNPLWYQMSRKQQSKSPQEIKYYKCAYLEEEKGIWLTDGCHMVQGSDPPNCTCDHMTNFALLVQTHHHMADYSLEVFGRILCCISIIGLGLMLFIHLYFPTLRHSEIVKVHCHLAVNLIISYIILLTATERPKPHGACLASAAFLQFFLLSAWGWMLVECLTMYRKLVAVFSSSISHYVTKCAVGVVTVAATITLITVLVSVLWFDRENDGWYAPGYDFVPSSYVSDRMCWLHGYSLIFGFLIPIGIAFIINTIGSILILRAVTWGRKKITSTSRNKEGFKSYVFRTMTISVLLGTCWAFAIPLTFSDDPTVNTIFGWLFSITNALQGFFIFIILCVRRKDVRKLWWNEIKSFFKGRSKDGEWKDSGRDTRFISTTADGHDPGTASSEVPRSTSKNKSVVEEVVEEGSDKKARYEHVDLGEISSFKPIPLED